MTPTAITIFDLISTATEVASTSDAAKASTSSTTTIFGHPLTTAEASLILEIVKASLLTLGAAISVLVFNSLAKRREQDVSLFNEIIKLKIVALHKVNSLLVALVSEYIALLDRLGANATLLPSIADPARHDHVQKTLDAIRIYRLALPKRRDRLLTALADARYEIGEINYLAMCQRLSYFLERVQHLWEFHGHSREIWTSNLQNAVGQSDEESTERLHSLVSEAVGKAGHREMLDLISSLQDDFENVIRRKGKGRRYALPVNVDDETGLYRINPLHVEIRERIATLITRLGRRA